MVLAGDSPAECVDRWKTNRHEVITTYVSLFYTARVATKKEIWAGTKLVGFIVSAVLFHVANKFTFNRDRRRCGCLIRTSEYGHIHIMPNEMKVMACPTCNSTYRVPVTWFASSCIFLDSDRFLIVQRDKMVSGLAEFY